jgi:oligopeptide transport system substrate-binding protein
MCSRGSWFGDFGDPTTFLDISRSDDGNNDRAYNSPAYDALLDAAQLERDPSKRMELLQRAEAMVIEDDCALAPVFYYRQVFMFDARKVAGISPHPRQKQYLYRMDILGDGRGADRPQEMPLRPR